MNNRTKNYIIPLLIAMQSSITLPMDSAVPFKPLHDPGKGVSPDKVAPKVPRRTFASLLSSARHDLATKAHAQDTLVINAPGSDVERKTKEDAAAHDSITDPLISENTDSSAPSASRAATIPTLKRMDTFDILEPDVAIPARPKPSPSILKRVGRGVYKHREAIAKGTALTLLVNGGALGAIKIGEKITGQDLAPEWMDHLDTGNDIFECLGMVGAGVYAGVQQCRTKQSSSSSAALSQSPNDQIVDQFQDPESQQPVQTCSIKKAAGATGKIVVGALILNSGILGFMKIYEKIFGDNRTPEEMSTAMEISDTTNDVAQFVAAVGAAGYVLGKRHCCCF